MKKLFFVCLAAIAVSCTSNVDKALSAEGYVDWLYESMPLPDELMYPRGFWESNVDKTLEVRDRMGWNIPEREFRHFVLPLRVNNENLDDFRTYYADTLCERVSGLSLADAVLEINHWCHEHVEYTPSDGRTSAPMATIATGYGRCGEESVLTVAALRAAGIPARQVYTPRWAHTDDNHAWVEAWVDGKWHFLGACEPEPVLDLGWFNAPVSRALLLHTKVDGDYHGDEDVIDRNAIYTEINVIRNYVPARRTVVTVTDGTGRPVRGATVRFGIYNYAEFYTVSTQTTDAQGHAALDMGLGDMMVTAWKDGRFAMAKADSDEVTVCLDCNEGQRYSFDFDIVPPSENPLPNLATEEQIAANAVRLREEDRIRALMHSRPVNEATLEAFKAEYADDPASDAMAQLLLASISAKDHHDITPDVLEDAMSAGATLDADVLCPRVENERLLPFKAAIRAGLEGVVSSPEEIVSWTRDNIEIVEGRNPQGLRTAPVAVWNARRADARGRDFFFVAACRALGFPARVDRVTGKTQFRRGDVWLDVDFEGASAVESPKGNLVLLSDGTPNYFYDFTLSRLENGLAKLMFDEDYPVGDGLSFTMDEGYYLLTSGKRLPDGSVLSHVELFYLPAGETTEIPLVIRSAGETALQVVGQMSDVSYCSGDWCILALAKESDEPTNHALRLLEGMDNVVVIWPSDPRYAGLVQAVREGCKADPDYIPYVLLTDKSGKVYYFSQGYNTSLKENLEELIPKL